MDRLNELWPEFWQAALETLYMTSFALVLGGILGLAVGVLLYVTRPGGLMPNRVVSGLINFVVNFFRPIPFVIFMAVAQPFARLVVGSGIGTTAGAFIIGLAAAFAIGRIVEQHLVSVSPGVIEAARAMGAGPWRILFTVAIPESLGPLILGYTFIVVALIDMTAMAGLIGGGGLGAFAQIYGFRQFEPLVMWAAIILIVVFVHLVQLLGTRLARKVMRR
ncbi:MULTISPECIES: methionine ABC transporter permease [Microbacterium]|jgi:D-methionine transport system permease protein|uniref:D-methionine transport system permease protein n=1 Tax=Microbacterium paraoxydans TaxID=199592 RepID=A0A1H1P9K2_9MICO|nr:MULTISPECIES: methionine ABC transporter permease [Microbacterium]AMG82105.1 methionine ABC transporter ATP-binding protein [Microbacterium sp. PAMC 28756]AVL97745.1 ABC transporter permease [Microbacterium sp. str. 'China']MCK2032303.1 ABC transporter permease [Microbacterium sp. KSW4-4]MCT2224970.1 ABC transporter permease [Microbacterium paraoxydans]OSP05166.1 ABC transporter permease [Microbacterium sp. LEMMJ01]